MGPYLFATVLTNVLARGRSGAEDPAGSGGGRGGQPGLALEALRWATKHGDSVVARLMLMPGGHSEAPDYHRAHAGAAGGRQRALTELLRWDTAVV